MLLYLFVDILPGLNPRWYIRIYKCDFTSLELELSSNWPYPINNNNIVSLQSRF